jgi:predicted RNA-binding Zn-ribbon protein involved in translation (DUF1610 family)
MFVSVTQKKTCSECGLELTGDEEVCPRCGNVFRKVEKHRRRLKAAQRSDSEKR